MKRAIVLSGGGAKGSYEVGVWKALRRLHIKYDIVTGTSIGALNGALMTQNTYYRAKHIWYKLSLDYLFDKHAKSTKDIDILKLFGQNFVKQGGMQLDKIENIIKENIHIKRFYNSKIDFGLITFNLTTKKPLALPKEKIKEEKLVDYLMASATCFPAFQLKNIDGKKYMDGGVYDNLPINLAIKMGADELIIVDLKAPGIKQKPKEKKKTIYIKPKNNISFFLNFNKEQAIENMNFGYNDTMKAFKKLDGNLFTFKKNTIKNSYNKMQSTLTRKLKKKLTKRNYLLLIESLGKTFELKEDRIYSLNSFKKQIQKNIDKQGPITKELKKQITSLKIKKISNSKIITLYFLGHLEKKKKIDTKLKLFFQKNYEQAVLLQQMGCH